MRRVLVPVYCSFSVPRNLKEEYLPRKYYETGIRIFSQTTPGRMAKKGCIKKLKDAHTPKDRRDCYINYLKECNEYLKNIDANESIQTGNMPVSKFDAKTKTVSFVQVGGRKNVKSLDEMAQDDDTVLVRLNSDINFTNDTTNETQNPKPSPLALYNKRTGVLAIQCAYTKDKDGNIIGDHPNPVYMKLDAETAKHVLHSQDDHRRGLAINNVIQYVANFKDKRICTKLVSRNTKDDMPSEYQILKDDQKIHRSLELSKEDQQAFLDGKDKVLDDRPYASFSEDEEESRGFASKGGIITTLTGAYINKHDGVLVNLNHPDFDGIRWQREIIINGSGPLILNKSTSEYIPPKEKRTNN